MASLSPEKLHTRFISPTHPEGPLQPRCYTLTHSDRTGDLFLTIATDYDHKQISGWYTRLMRDEVLATWKHDKGELSLHIHCHVSGGIVLGTATWRANIFRHHMRQVLQAFRFGDQALVKVLPELDAAQVKVHFHARQEQLNQVEAWGKFGDYKIGS
jgi:hypothetical protein